MFDKYIRTKNMTKVVTKRQVLMKKYEELIEYLSGFVQGEIFPVLDETTGLDLVDLIYYITTLFLGVESNDDYEDRIKELIIQRKVHVSDKDIITVLPSIITFIRELKSM